VVVFAVDGTTDFDFPAGTFSFATGAAPGQRVYNTTTASYTTVDVYYPSVGLVYDPFPPLFFPTIVPAIGFGVVYDPVIYGGYSYGYGYDYIDYGYGGLYY
jgi:hypothetical protein